MKDNLLKEITRNGELMNISKNYQEYYGKIKIGALFLKHYNVDKKQVNKLLRLVEKDYERCKEKWKKFI